jgi:hypothetical protein
LTPIEERAATLVKLDRRSASLIASGNDDHVRTLAPRGSAMIGWVQRWTQSSAAHVGFAFFAMGGWAEFANRGAGPGHAALAGAVQGSISGAITLGLKRFLESASQRLSGGWAAIVPPLISCAVILAMLVTAHRLAGTRQLWTTISVPYAVSSSYAFIYTAMILRLRRRQAEATTP